MDNSSAMSVEEPHAHTVCVLILLMDSILKCLDQLSRDPDLSLPFLRYGGKDDSCSLFCYLYEDHILNPKKVLSLVALLELEREAAVLSVFDDPLRSLKVSSILLIVFCCFYSRLLTVS